MWLRMLTPVVRFVHNEEVKGDVVHSAAGWPDGKLVRMDLVGSHDEVNNFPGLAAFNATDPGAPGTIFGLTETVSGYARSPKMGKPPHQHYLDCPGLLLFQLLRKVDIE